MQDAAKRGVEGAVRASETAVGVESKAVICRPLLEAERLAVSDHQVYATYYQLLNSGVRQPDGDAWDRMRRPTDEILFPGYREDIRMGALTLDGVGVWNYGDCCLVPRDDMVAHRATVFEENSVVWMQRHGVRAADPTGPPRGYRASCKARGRLAVAKLAHKVHGHASSSGFAGLLLEQGSTSGDDRYIEVHVWGPMTVRTLEHVVSRRPRTKAGEVLLGALRERLLKAGVELTVRP